MLVPSNMSKPPVVYLLNVPRRCFFCGFFCYLCLVFSLFRPSCLFLAVLWSPTKKGLISWFSCVSRFLVFLSLSHTVSWVIVSIPALYILPYFALSFQGMLSTDTKCSTMQI